MNGQGNILFSGLGGQGIMLASEITAHSLIAAGYQVKKSEIHGMAQRGGPAVAHLRYGQQIHSPVIDPGQVDTLVSFEALEVLRHLPMLRPGCRILLNTLRVEPRGWQPAPAEPPADLAVALRALGHEVLEIDALSISTGTGLPQSMNIALLGGLSLLLPVAEQHFVACLRHQVPPRFLEHNLQAFKAGRQEAAAQRGH